MSTFYRELSLHILTVVLVFCSIYFVIPNLSTNLKEYQSETKTLKDTRIDEEEYTRKFRKRIKKH